MRESFININVIDENKLVDLGRFVDACGILSLLLLLLLLLQLLMLLLKLLLLFQDRSFKRLEINISISISIASIKRLVFLTSDFNCEAKMIFSSLRRRLL
jgi:hypothetical protein